MDKNFNLFSDFKQYGKDRLKIRLNGLGYINTRIHIVRFKKLKGFKKHLDHLRELGGEVDNELYNSVSKEIEFREMCLSMRSIFDIKIK